MLARLEKPKLNETGGELREDPEKAGRRGARTRRRRFTAWSALDRRRARATKYTR
jgi:hypothetical protein